MSGACNKAADCLSWLVDVKDTPTTPTASIYMLVTSTLDGPVTHTCSKTCNPTDTTQPTGPTTTSTTDKVEYTSTSHSRSKGHSWANAEDESFLQTYFQEITQWQSTLVWSRQILHIIGIIYKHVMDSNQPFLALVNPNSWHFTVLIEVHDKWGHQGVNRTYHLIKHQYYWKGMNREIHKYICH